eukprot:15364344-Ditylum_brightwellii.AAC.1
MAGQMIWVAMSWAQHQSRWEIPILQDTGVRIDNEYLMPVAVKSQCFITEEIKCYLNVTAVSDITLANRQQLDKHMIGGNISLMSNMFCQYGSKATKARAKVMVDMEIIS